MFSDKELTEVLNDTVIHEAESYWLKNRIMARNLDGSLARSWAPEGVGDEYKDLMKKSRSPWLKFAARVIAQGLVVDGYSDGEVWRDVWQASGMDGKQGALNEQVAGYGYGYLLTFPADNGGVLMRPLSVLKTFAWHEDDWSDIPDLVIHKVNDTFWRVFDSESMYEITGELAKPRDIARIEHGIGVNPVTPVYSSFTIDGLPESLVLPGLPAYKRIVDATFSLQMTQRYAGFPQKWQTGGQIGENEAGEADIRPSVDSLLHADDPTAKFGAFPSGDLNQVIAAVDKHIQDLAVMTQIPPHYLLGKVVNLSSDALAATESAYNRLIGTVRESAGEGYESALRIGAAILGDSAAASNLSSEVHWRATAVRALGASVDAVSKLHATGMPRELSYKLIPDFTQADIEAAVERANDTSASVVERDGDANNSPVIPDGEETEK